MEQIDTRIQVYTGIQYTGIGGVHQSIYSS